MAGLLVHKQNFQCYRLRHLSSCKCSQALWANPIRVRSLLSRSLWLTQRAGLLVLTCKSNRLVAGAADHTCGERDDSSALCVRSRQPPLDLLSFIGLSRNYIVFVRFPRDTEKCIVRWFYPVRTVKARQTLLTHSVPIHPTAHDNLRRVKLVADQANSPRPG